MGWPPPGPNTFRFHDNQLEYILFDDDVYRKCGNKVVVPTDDQWLDFWKLCDEVDVWSWPEDVSNNNVIDGIEWRINYQIGDRRVRSYGQVSGAPSHIQENLFRLHEALQAVTGWVNPYPLEEEGF